MKISLLSLLLFLFLAPSLYSQDLNFSDLDAAKIDTLIVNSQFCTIYTADNHSKGTISKGTMVFVYPDSKLIPRAHFFDINRKYLGIGRVPALRKLNNIETINFKIQTMSSDSNDDSTIIAFQNQILAAILNEQKDIKAIVVENEKNTRTIKNINVFFAVLTLAALAIPMISR